jgi:uncharacterized protein (DUF342 family)
MKMGETDMSIFSDEYKPSSMFSSAADNAPAVDSVLKVVFQDRGLSACLNIKTPSGNGAPPTVASMKEKLNSVGVKFGIDEAQLAALENHPVYNLDVTIASGTPPVNGEDGSIEILIDSENKGKPKEDADGKVDLRDLGIVDNVKKGQVLCIIHPPTPGSPGMSVKGDKLLQKPGKQALIIAGANTELSPDGTQIIAKIDGQFDFNGRKINVNETFTVNNNVDNSTGNITVAGNLVVRGMVTAGFTIEAAGSITVNGFTESATLKAGGDIKLQGGVTGSTIRCGGDLKSKHIENSDVFVRGEIRADYILNSTVKCGRNLKTEGSISKIIGGTCVVGQNIEARMIGSPSVVKTKLELGSDPISIERQQELLELIPELEKQIKAIEPLLKLLQQLEAANRLTPDKAEALTKAKHTFHTQSAMLEDARMELNEINSAIFNKGFGRVICPGTIYPGTVVSIGSALYNVTDNLINASLYYRDGFIAIGIAK